MIKDFSFTEVFTLWGRTVNSRNISSRLRQWWDVGKPQMQLFVVSWMYYSQIYLTQAMQGLEWGILELDKTLSRETSMRLYQTL